MLVEIKGLTKTFSELSFGYECGFLEFVEERGYSVSRRPEPDNKDVIFKAFFGRVY